MEEGSVILKAIKAGDKTIEQLITYKAKLIGLSLSCIVNLLNPEMIVLGGGLVEAMPELIVRQVKKSVREHAMPGFMKEMKIVSARLGDHAIVKGAAKLAWDSAMQKADKRR
jgi:glucokinase